MDAERRDGRTLIATHPRVTVWGQFWALLFVLLIVLPFTAPFQTVDLTQHSPTTGSALTTAKDLTKDLAVSATLVRSAVTVIRLANASATRRHTPLLRAAHLTILRL